MNNNNLFDMYGIEEPPKQVEDNNSQPNILENNSTQPNTNDVNNSPEQISENPNNQPQTQIQQINNGNNTSSFVKPIPDEVMKEVHTKDNKDKELLKLFIGQNFESIVYGGFSFCTLLFGANYMVYRKQYGSAFILFILNILLLLSPLLMQSSISIIFFLINFITIIYFSLNFKSSYVAKAKETIDRIMFQKLSIEEKQEMIKKAGGTDNRAFIFYFLMMIISSVISFFVFKNQLF